MNARRRKASVIARMLRLVPPAATIWTVEDDGTLWFRQLSRREDKEYAGILRTGEIGHIDGRVRIYTSTSL